MVTKSKNETAPEKRKKSRVKTGDLKLNKETVKDLTRAERKQIKGGYGVSGYCTVGGCTV